MVYFALAVGGVTIGLLILAGVIAAAAWVGAACLALGAGIVVVPMALLLVLRPVRQPPMTAGDVLSELLANLFGPWWLL